MKISIAFIGVGLELYIQYVLGDGSFLSGSVEVSYHRQKNNTMTVGL